MDGKALPIRQPGHPVRTATPRKTPRQSRSSQKTKVKRLELNQTLRRQLHRNQFQGARRPELNQRRKSSRREAGQASNTKRSPLKKMRSRRTPPQSERILD